ncbi:MAG: PqqD family protein [Candidatus Omnitrophota bacterium]|nr:PqqD family protein [Candidatus Omnitrophota bacterium]
MPLNNMVIVRGKRQCVFMRDEDGFHLIVMCDESWQDQAPGHVSEKDYILMFSLSSSAACVWEMLKDCPTEEKLLSTVIDKAGASENKIRDTISRFLKTLKGYALINYAPGSDSERFPVYQLAPGCDNVPTGDIVFDIEGISIEPVKLTQDVFCGSSGYQSPINEDPGCQLC